MAAIEFRCPACGHTTKVTGEYCGQTGPCAHCGSTVTVPRAPVEPAPKGDSTILGRGLAFAVLTSIGLLIGAILSMTGLKLTEPVAKSIVVAANQRESKANLARIATAMLAYHKQYGEFPPAVVRDSSGRAMHSWRVLILPFLGPGEKSLYQDYKLDEPWDSQANSSLHRRMPVVYGSSIDTGRNQGETNYFVITGKKGLFHDGRTAKVESPATDPAQTVLVVELINQTAASWLEPRDFPASSLDGRVNSGLPGQLNGVHEGGVFIAGADGEIHFVSENATPEELRGWMILED